MLRLSDPGLAAPALQRDEEEGITVQKLAKAKVDPKWVLPACPALHRLAGHAAACAAASDPANTSHVWPVAAGRAQC